MLTTSNAYRICPIGERALKLSQTKEDYLLEVLDKGALEAQKKANKTLARIKENAGILRKKV